MRIFALVGESIKDEPTAIEELKEAEELADKDAQYDSLYEEVVEEQKEEASEVVETTSSFGSSDSGSDDSGSDDDDGSGDDDLDDDFGDEDTDGEDSDDDDDDGEDGEEDASSEDEPDEPEEDTDDSDKEDDSVNAAESIRNATSSVLVDEDFKETAIKVGGGLIAGAWIGFKYLANLGIKYGPVAAKLAGRTLYKTVVFLFVGAVKGILVMRRKLATYIRNKDSKIKSLEEQLAGLRKDLETRIEHDKERAELQEGENPQEVEQLGSITNLRDISWFMVGPKVDPQLSTAIMRKFGTEVVTNMLATTLSDLDKLKRITELSLGQNRSVIANLLESKAPTGGFIKKEMKGYVKDSNLLDMYVYNTELPNRVAAIISVPKPHLDDMDSLSRAYQLSGAILGVSENNYVTPSKLDYMTTEQSKTMLDGLAELIQICRVNQSHLREIAKQTSEITMGYKSYFERLIDTKEAISVKDSLAEVINMKQTFINKTYLPCAMDIQDYLVAYIDRCMKYAKASIK